MRRGPPTSSREYPRGATEWLQRLRNTRVLDGESKVQSLVTVSLTRFQIRLVQSLLLRCHRIPLLLLLLVQANQNLALDYHRNEGQGTESDADCVSLLIVRFIVFAVNLRTDQGANLDDDVVSSCCDGAFLHVERVFRDPGRDERMEVWVSRNESDERKARPLAATVRQSNEGYQQRHYPELAKDDVQSTLVEMVAAPCESQHGYDLENGRRNRQHVRIER